MLRGEEGKLDLLYNFQALKGFERRVEGRLGVVAHSPPQEHIHLGVYTHKPTYPTPAERCWKWTDPC